MGSIMGGLLSNFFNKNACVIRKTRFNIFWKFPVYFRIFPSINKNDIFRQENLIFEWKVIFNIDFYDPKDLKKHSCLICKGLFFLTICPTVYYQAIVCVRLVATKSDLNMMLG